MAASSRPDNGDGHHSSSMAKQPPASGLDPDQGARGRTGGVPSESLRPAARLKRRVDFRRVQSTGRKVHTTHFVFAVLPRPDGGTETRIGITVTRKIAHAVGRNRVKRVMREVFRRHRALFPNACDVVAIAKTDAQRLGFADVLLEITQAQRAMAHAGRARSGPSRGAGSA